MADPVGFVVPRVGHPAFYLQDETTLTVFTGMFEEATTEWQALLDWCRFHGLDPERMPATQTIERDVAGCRILYDAYVMTADEVQLRARYWRQIQGEPERRRAVEQGEAPPLPFPDVILRHLHPRQEPA